MPPFRTRETPFTPNDLLSLESNLVEGCTISLYEPSDSATWLESNWDNSSCVAVRNKYGDPIPCMLSAEESAFAIFAPSSNEEVAYMALSLANVSGFSVIVHPVHHNPALTLLCVNHIRLGGYTENNLMNNNRSHSQEAEDEFSAFEQTADGNEDGEGNDDALAQTGFSIDSTEPPEAHGAAKFEGGADGGGGGDGGGPTMTGDEWESPLHRTRVKLDLRISDARAFAVTVGCSFKFKINRNTDIPINLADLTQPLSQPEVISLVDLALETRPREVHMDRSYANFGFISHRQESISQRKFLHRGFEHPEKIYKYGKQQEDQRGVKANLGFSQGSPLLTTALSYNRNNNTTLEAVDNKVLPRCHLVYEIGDEWDENSKSYSSYNIAYQLQRPEFETVHREPVEVRVGMGINLHPPVIQPLPKISFVVRKQVLIWVADPTSKAKIRGILVLMTNYHDNIESPNAVYISEKQQVNLGASAGHLLSAKDQQGSSGIISLSLAEVEKSGRPGTKIPPHEYLARGWDANNEEWRSVLWPVLDKDFRATDVEGTLPVWNLQCPRRAVQPGSWNQTTNRSAP
ncbi:hypothetical protein R3P38DRAFT_2501646 [Favolaschia claudopus]|uniref:Uncharacterized protein n=1 Tax=Favolaschia claudopus TaxID=2862362 RepID=A0AAW0DMX5_9AGAR